MEPSEKPQAGKTEKLVIMQHNPARDTNQSHERSLPFSGSIFFGSFFLLRFPDFFFKFPELSTVGFPGTPGFSGEFVQRKFLFNEVAYPAFLCKPKDPPFVRQNLILHMSVGIKILVKVATLAILTDDPVVLLGRICAIKSFLNRFGVTTASHHPK